MIASTSARRSLSSTVPRRRSVAPRSASSGARSPVLTVITLDSIYGQRSHKLTLVSRKLWRRPRQVHLSSPHQVFRCFRSRHVVPFVDIKKGLRAGVGSEGRFSFGCIGRGKDKTNCLALRHSIQKDVKSQPRKGLFAPELLVFDDIT